GLSLCAHHEFVIEIERGLHLADDTEICIERPKGGGSASPAMPIPNGRYGNMLAVAGPYCILCRLLTAPGSRRASPRARAITIFRGGTHARDSNACRTVCRRGVRAGRLRRARRRCRQ